MKKMVVVLLALFCTSTLLYARTDHTKGKVAVLKNDALIKVCYESPSKSTVDVFIRDLEGRELFHEQINDSSFIRPYNFSKLPRGDYQLLIRDDAGEHVEKIMHYDRAYIGHVVKLDDSGNKYLVTIPKMGNNEVSICVYDANDNLVFTEVADHHSDYAKVYNLKNFNDASIEIFDRD